MAHKTLIGGTAYEIKGGRDLIGGTGYAKKSGKALINGTAYSIEFGPSGPFTLRIKATNNGNIDYYVKITENGNQIYQGMSKFDTVKSLEKGTVVTVTASLETQVNGVKVAGSFETYTFEIMSDVTITPSWVNEGSSRMGWVAAITM